MDARGVYCEGNLDVAVEIAALGGAQQVLHQVAGFGRVQADERNQGECKCRMLGEHVAFAGARLLRGDGGIDVLTSSGIVAPEHGDHGTRRREPGVGRLGIADLAGEFREHGFGRVEPPLQNADVGHVGGMACRVQTETVASVDRGFRWRPDGERVTQATGKGNVDVALWQCGKHINRKRIRQEAPLVNGSFVPFQQRIEIAEVAAYHVAAEQGFEQVAVDTGSRPCVLEGLEDLPESTFALRADGQWHRPVSCCCDPDVRRRRSNADPGVDQFVVRPPNLRLGEVAAEQCNARLRQNLSGAVHTESVGCDDSVGLRDEAGTG
ncbi:MAG: hypothetical protein F4Y41_20240 [Gammaproteobacteria bacterium]|nr:hypothetical protein [Gammaproteobacteria bacterium]